MTARIKRLRVALALTAVLGGVFAASTPAQAAHEVSVEFACKVVLTNGTVFFPSVPPGIGASRDGAIDCGPNKASYLGDKTLPGGSQKSDMDGAPYNYCNATKRATNKANKPGFKPPSQNAKGNCTITSEKGEIVVGPHPDTNVGPYCGQSGGHISVNVEIQQPGGAPKQVFELDGLYQNNGPAATGVVTVTKKGTSQSGSGVAAFQVRPKSEGGESCAQTGPGADVFVVTGTLTFTTA